MNEVLTQVQSAHHYTSNLSWNDPQLVLKMAAGKTRLPSCYDTTEFANLASAMIREEVVGNSAGGTQLFWRTGKQELKLSSLTISQWSVANLTILSRLKKRESLIAAPLLTCHIPHLYISYFSAMTPLPSTCMTESTGKGKGHQNDQALPIVMPAGVVRRLTLIGSQYEVHKACHELIHCGCKMPEVDS